MSSDEPNGPNKKNEPDTAADRDDAAGADHEVLPPDITEKLLAQGLDLDNPEIRRIIQVVSATREYTEGPVPPPGMLAKYEEIHPGFTNRMLDMVDRQSEHRRAIEAQLVNGSERRKNLGQMMAGIVAIGGLSLAGYLALTGLVAVPIVIALVSIGGPTAAIAISRKISPGAGNGDD